MKKKSTAPKNTPDQEPNDPEIKNEPVKPYERWKHEDKNNMGNDVSSEIKIANAEGEMEGGDNKQWHMDQGNFDEQEKKDFEDPADKK